MSEEQFDMLQDIAANGWENPWRCESCKSVLGALDDRINKNTAEIARVADKVEANEENISANTGKIKAMEEAMLKIQEKSLIFTRGQLFPRHRKIEGFLFGRGPDLTI